MYNKLPQDTINLYESIMGQFTKELLPPDYQEFLDKVDDDYYPEPSDFNNPPF